MDTHVHTHTTHAPSSFYTCFLVSFPFHLILLPSLLFNASASVVYSISVPCCSLRHRLPLCPPYFSHNFTPSPPQLLFSSFSCTSCCFPVLSFTCGFHPSFVSLCSPSFASTLLSYLLLLLVCRILISPFSRLFSFPPSFPPLVLLCAFPLSLTPPPASARLTLAEL